MCLSFFGWRLWRVGALAGALYVAGAPHAAAQQPAPVAKAAPVTMIYTTASAAARAAYASAVSDMSFWNGRHAVPALRKALELDSHFALARAGIAMWQPGLTQPERVKEAEQAVADARNATTPELLLTIAVRDVQRGDWGNMLPVMDAARALAPDDPYVAFLDVVFRVTPGHIEDSLEPARTYLARNPDAAFMHAVLAWSEWMVGQHPEGVADIERALTLAPEQPFAHDVHAELMWREGRYDESIPEYRRALEVDPTWVGAYTSLANVEYLRRDYRAARGYMQEALTHAADLDARFAALYGLAALAAFDKSEAPLRAAWADVITEGTRANRPQQVASAHGALAVLAAIDGDRTRAEKELALAPPKLEDGPYLTGLEVYTLLGDAARAAAERDGILADQGKPGYWKEWPAFARTLAATAAGDVRGAADEMKGLKDYYLRIRAQAILLRAARKSGDKEIAAAAEAELRNFKELEYSAGFARRLVGLP